MSGGFPGSDMRHQRSHEWHHVNVDGAGVERCRLGPVFDRLFRVHSAVARCAVDHDHGHPLRGARHTRSSRHRLHHRFPDGGILRPWTRFAGQTSYTQGAASILVDVQGGFTWERRTGKTIYISIRSEGGPVVSNRLILRTTWPPTKRVDSPRDSTVRFNYDT